MEKMSELSFSEFNESSLEQWKQLVQKELGERSMDTLNWTVDDGIEVGPYEVSPDHDYSHAYSPVQQQYQLITQSDAKEWNRIALESLMGGTNALGIDCACLSPESLPSLLVGIEVKFISLHFVNMRDGIAWAKAFKRYCDDSSIDTTQLSGSFERGELLAGKDEVQEWYKQSRMNFPRFRIMVVEVNQIHDQGGSIVHELLWALTAGHETLQLLMNVGVSVDEASACLQFNFSMGSSYFPHMAKLRAFRWMWKRIVEAYGPVHDCSVNTFLQVSTSRYLQTAKDKHNNLLRATTQAMSAYLGGADSVNVLPFDSWSVKSDETSLRWSRNIQQLLLEESYFSQYRSAADGSYYVENLTDKMVRTVWVQFQELDALAARVGIESARGDLEKAVKSFAAVQRNLVSEGKRVIVGVNRYVNKTDSAVVEEGAQTLSAPLEKA